MIVIKDSDGWPVDIIFYPPDGWDEMFIPDPVWSDDK